MDPLRSNHFGPDGRPVMVDVSPKPRTVRRAVAVGHVLMSAAAMDSLLNGDTAKGDVRAIAELAGIMGAKRTADLIPLCHSLALDSLYVRIEPLADRSGLHVRAEAVTTARTGVEMEALTAVSVACLTVYDMLKSIDRSMTISAIHLLEKSGGASGDYRRETP
jgi:cyclic pyranopterin phosphate synthase